MATDFFERVYYIVSKIPKGRVTTYGAIANAIYSPKSARVVGYALRASKNRTDIPAHRVLNKQGLLTGKFHFSSLHAMEELLRSEGVEVEDNQVVNLEKYFWNPLKALDMEQVWEDFQQNVKK